MSLEASLRGFDEQHPRLFALGLFFFAWSLRAVLTASACAWTGLSCRTLPLLYDGHIYLLISKSFPFPYHDVHKIFPAYKNSEYFTGWFPLFPFLIYLASFFFRNFLLSALVVSQVASSAAVVLFHRIAKRKLPAPMLATVLFCFFPPTWLLVGSLAFSESVLVCLALAAFDRFETGRTFQAVFLTGLALITQKSGFLLLLVFLCSLIARFGRAGLWKFGVYLWSLVAPALMQVYFYLLFGELWINVRIQREIFAASIFRLPFESMIRGLGSPTQIFQGQFWLRKAAIGLSCLFYTGVLALSYKRLPKKDWPLIFWLAVVLIFHLSLGGIWAYYAFPRFMTLAAAPALLLVARLAGDKRIRVWAVLALCVLPLSLAIDTIDVSSSAELLLRSWPKGYFESLITCL